MPASKESPFAEWAQLAHELAELDPERFDKLLVAMREVVATTREIHRPWYLHGQEAN